jgi:hypothetical protein
MLLLELKAQLGNQMFQYAAAKYLSERTGLPLYLVNSGRGGIHHLLYDSFEIAESKRHYLWMARLLNRRFLNGHWKLFRPEKQFLDKSELEWEAYDDSFYQIKRFTKIRGYYQCAQYFDYDFEWVASLFQPKPSIAQKVEEKALRLGLEDSHVCSVHVRRQDYVSADSGIGDAQTGWALPASYYHKAIEGFPKYTRFVFFGDDPAWCEETFGYLHNKQIVRGNSPIVDMLLLARFKDAILSNSTFAWWAAALNRVPGANLIFPEYFLGFRKGVWIPPRVQVEHWKYLSVTSK